MRWPERDSLARLLLAGNLAFPFAIWLVGETAEPRAIDEIDWNAESPRARLIDFFLGAHASYALGLVFVLRGWRCLAIVLGVALFLVSAVTNFFAYFAVTGVYW